MSAIIRWTSTGKPPPYAIYPVTNFKLNACVNAYHLVLPHTNAPQKRTHSSPIVCDGCKQQICRQCAVAGSSGVPNASSPSWNCKLCNSFLKGSHTACDWLLQQLNQRFASRQSEEAEKRFVDKRHSNETTKEADRVGGKSIEWNSSGKWI